MSLRIAKVLLKPSKNRLKKRARPISLICVYGQIEKGSHLGQKWILLTNQGQAIIDNAIKIISLYAKCTPIRQHFRHWLMALKVEKQRRLTEGEDIVKGIINDSMIVCRLSHFLYNSRYNPFVSAEGYFSPHELTALSNLLKARNLSEYIPF